MSAWNTLAEKDAALFAPRAANANGGSVTTGPRHLTPSERALRGLDARKTLPPRAQAELALPANRPDPVSLIEEQAKSRIPELVPVRHGRMMVSPFTFFRGNALGMACDLAAGPVSGLGAQLCGDAHLTNFGLFGSAERRLLFDVNDFDETMPGPWEWDVKRLAASIAVAGRGNGFSKKERRKAVVHTVRRYRDAIAEFATMGALDVWYARADVDELQEMARSKMSSSRRKNLAEVTLKARASGNLKAFSKLTELTDDGVRIKADPPLVIPLADLLPDDVSRIEIETELRKLLMNYRRSLPQERRTLFDQFEFVDMARKVVGVGSVGTRCWIVLLRGRDDGDPLFLQVKEAGPSVLKGKVPSFLRQRSGPRNEGERVVVGQRLMQASSDIFLGWQRVDGLEGVRDFYVRQLRDMKGSAVVDRQDPRTMTIYGQLCGWTLAKAHARSGDRIALATYLNSDDAFPEAMAEYAEAYADLNESDYQAFLDAIKSGRLEAEPGL